MSVGAERILAGVVLSERVSAGTYGILFRAQYQGLRDVRALLIDERLLAEPSFRASLSDEKALVKLTQLDHPALVPVLAVESEGAEVIVVTRGIGKYVTLYDLITKARVRGSQLSAEISALIVIAILNGLAKAHQSGIVHGGIHPRSVLIDQAGGIHLTDFAVGHALTSAIAGGVDASLWRGLSGYIPPELVMGDAPSARGDVFAIGALITSLLTGEIPPADNPGQSSVSKLCQRAMSGNPALRSVDASAMAREFADALYHDGTDPATTSSLLALSRLGRAGTNLDDDTEDMLAALGEVIARAPMRPSGELRSTVMHSEDDVSIVGERPPSNVGLDDLLDDLSTVGGAPHRAVPLVSPLSELRVDNAVEIKHRFAAGKAMILDGSHASEESTPLPTPISTFEESRGYIDLPISKEVELTSRVDDSASAALYALSDLGLDDDVTALRSPVGSADSAENATDVDTAALDAALNFDTVEIPIVRSTKAKAIKPHASAEKLLDVDRTKRDQVAARASKPERALPAGLLGPKTGPAPEPLLARSTTGPLDLFSQTAPVEKLSRPTWWIWLVLTAVICGLGVFLFLRQERQKKEITESLARDKEQRSQVLAAAVAAQPKAGSIRIRSNPGQAGVWLSLGRTPVTSFLLSAARQHELRLELEGFESVDTQVLPGSWTGSSDAQRALITVGMRPGANVLAPTPPAPIAAQGYPTGNGVLHIESNPPGAAVWLFMGVSDSMELGGIESGKEFEFKLLKTGFVAGHAKVAASDWPGSGEMRVNKSIELAPLATGSARNR
jgi:serine/threonine protein kinase